MKAEKQPKPLSQRILLADYDHEGRGSHIFGTPSQSAARECRLVSYIILGIEFQKLLDKVERQLSNELPAPASALTGASSPSRVFCPDQRRLRRHVSLRTREQAFGATGL